jgi:hypothetical protein
VDPVTIAVLAVVALLGSGAGAVAAGRRRRAVERRDAMRVAVRSAIPIGNDPPVSLFDVFWDLGASDFALELMASARLLLDEPDELALVVDLLPTRVAEHGGYAAFVREQLEAMEEYYRAHRDAGDRRAVLALAAPATKALPAAGGSVTGSSALRVASDAERFGAALRDAAADRVAWRTGDREGPLLVGADGSIDVDQVVGIDVGRLLGSIFDGSIGREAKRWFAMRAARQLRDELDRALAGLYRVYATQVRPDPASIAHLYDAARRWDADATRIGALRSAGSSRERRWALCATILLEEAETMARSLALRAAANVDETLQRIDAAAQRGNTAMAGYLVYVNRWALFVGRMDLCHAQVGAIEGALARLQAELSAMQRKGVL